MSKKQGLHPAADDERQEQDALASAVRRGTQVALNRVVSLSSVLSTMAGMLGLLDVAGLLPPGASGWSPTVVLVLGGLFGAIVGFIAVRPRTDER